MVDLLTVLYSGTESALKCLLGGGGWGMSCAKGMPTNLMTGNTLDRKEACMETCWEWPPEIGLLGG